MATNTFNINGLTTEQVIQAREKYGENILRYKAENSFLNVIQKLVKEPMIILLFAAALIYLVSGKTGDAIFLASAIVLVSVISLYQDSRSRNALQKLKKLSQPHCKVIRNGEVVEINSDELVVGDSLIVEEGTAITADGIIIHSNDYSVNESVLTGESLPVFKDKTKEDNFVYKGTTVASGLAIANITEIGNDTKLGQIGKSLEGIKEEKTPLELQISSFVKTMVFAGTIVFLVVWGINYFKSLDLLDSLLKALTLAMSILPEEIPMAFTTFMAIGAWRLMKLGIVVKQMKTVETLGSATVICIDKTGTITENRMSLVKVFVLNSMKDSNLEKPTEEEKSLIQLAMWASEPIPFDAMELALHEGYEKMIELDERPGFKLIHEYPLGGKPPMMTHIFENEQGKRIIAAKGAPEAIIAVSKLTADQKKQVEEALFQLTKEGYRALGVGYSEFTGNNFPKTQEELSFHFSGLVAFYDPPKTNIKQVLEDFYNAGLSVKIITGDNGTTTTAIAKQIDFKGFDQVMSGDELMKLSEEELKDQVQKITVFCRMFPEAKLRIIDALKSNQEIVAMTGDGVNDGPALKAAHIGVAMGKKGTEIAKQAASLILIDDDLSKMVDAIAMGRKIYSNLKKAIQYIISIHIPIILTVFLPLALGWIYPNILTPVHIIFLELIMGPTCSIIFENEPMEKNTMIQKPRSFTTTFFNSKELTTSIIQGLMITLGSLLVYQLSVAQGNDEATTRTMVFTVLIFSNIFLTLVNRSFYYSVWTTLSYKNSLIHWIIGITLVITGLLLYVPPLTLFFHFKALTGNQIATCLVIGFSGVMWYELVKMKTRMKSPLSPKIENR